MTKISATLLLVLLPAIILLCTGGCSQKPTDTTAEPLPWIEYGGQFNTRDLDRAQEEIPFPILLPTYIPDKRKDIPPPSIKGILKEFQIKDDVEVDILYTVDLGLEVFGEEVFGTIMITESNHHISLGDTEVNPDLESIEIRNKIVVKAEYIGKYERNTEFYYSFNHEDIYYIVVIGGLTNEEAFKVVESMIKQLQ
jgi:hypothetical protein